MKKVLTAALILLLAATSLSAQNKAETKLYQKTLSKPSVEAFDKFLKKYPSSVYASDILARKDTLLNISPYDMAQAYAIARPLLPEDAVFRSARNFFPGDLDARLHIGDALQLRRLQVCRGGEDRDHHRDQHQAENRCQQSG